VDALSGRYITAEDMNTNVEDMNAIHRETQHVTGFGAHLGGSGDPSPVTALGVFHGIRACLDVVYGTSDVRGRKVAIQGVGNVGYNLAKYLHEGGAQIIASDINVGNLERVEKEFGATIVDGDEFFRSSCDVLAPCAIGGIINARTIDLVQAPILCGGANNILEDEQREGASLAERKITYAPDYVVNAGGLMNVYAELHGWPAEKAMADTEGIFNTVKQIVHRSQVEGVSSLTASNTIAEERIEAVGRLKRFHLSSN
jgi:leucine dehydrogenase